MHSHLCAWALAIFVLALAADVDAQAPVNPDISVIPRFVVKTDDGNGKFSTPDFAFEELELAVQAYLNPFAKGDIVLTVPGPDVEKSRMGIEEVYATVLRGLPWDLNLRFGKYRVEYGKLNSTHPHAWPFATQPLVAQRFLGEDGLNDLGISASILLPTGELYSKLTFDLLRGNSIGDGAGIPDTLGRKPYYANSARLMTFFPLSDNADMEVGISGLTGIHDPYFRHRFYYGNLDFKYKWRPDSYTSLVLQGEFLANRRKAELTPDFHYLLDANGVPSIRTVVSSGMYFYADYQFIKIFSIGTRFDWSETPYSNDDRAHAVSLFLGYYPVEETLGLRLQYQNTTTSTPATSQSVNALYLQILFSLGPHKAHPF